MDCHDLLRKSRNDREIAFLKKVDSRAKDSKYCGGAFVVFSKFVGRARLAVCGYPQIY